MTKLTLQNIGLILRGSDTYNKDKVHFNVMKTQRFVVLLVSVIKRVHCVAQLSEIRVMSFLEYIIFINCYALLQTHKSIACAHTVAMSLSLDHFIT